MRTIVDGEEECHYGVVVIYGGIPHGGAFPLAGGAHDGSQYPWP
jgi:hypothetical protein